MRQLLSVLAIAGCGVRTPARVDVDAILKSKGSAAARLDLEARVLAAPRDVGAHLALAAVADQLGRPSEAIAQLEVVENLGGPLGIRWHADDRARLARLLGSRGEVRLARGAVSAVSDLERARALGAAISDDQLQRARVAAAIVDLRHIDAGIRTRGARILARANDPRWRGARPDATLSERGSFGAWLWTIGAKRGAWLELSTWHDRTPAPRDAQLEAAYFTARTWWTPSDAAPPAASTLAGPERCRFVACDPAEVVRRDDPDELAALISTEPRGRVDVPRSTDPVEAVAWLELGLRAALRRDIAWGRIVRAHVDVEAFAAARFSTLPAAYRPVFARLLEAPVPMVVGGIGDMPGGDPIDPLVAGAERALAGQSVAAIRAALGPHAATIDGAALLALFAPRDAIEDPRAVAIALAVRGRVAGAPPAAQLQPIIAAFRRDPAIAERLGRELIAASVDDAVAHATLGALFEALEDPARARLGWQAAVDASSEPAFVQGLAEIQARAGDPDAALVTGYLAAAANGDPALSWLAIARALEESGSHAVALDAAKSAIDLAGPELVAPALRIAIAASRALDRYAQVSQLEARLADAVVPPRAPDRSDPTDVVGALAGYTDQPSAATLAQLWVASRWNPRDIGSRHAIAGATSGSDPRHTAVIAELVALAGDPALAAAALHALGDEHLAAPYRR